MKGLRSLQPGSSGMNCSVDADPPESGSADGNQECFDRSDTARQVRQPGIDQIASGQRVKRHARSIGCLAGPAPFGLPINIFSMRDRPDPNGLLLNLENDTVVANTQFPEGRERPPQAGSVAGGLDRQPRFDGLDDPPAQVRGNRWEILVQNLSPIENFVVGRCQRPLRQILRCRFTSA